ncbi:uncharacterized protein LOC109504189 [Harpegnathos saltator]|uniref:Uncharacterized protein n=1 Tax=Harpegnathos saltator TaxID=610380 RepID=E2BVL1_HARSA|nr:uncharacterized protein LOC109504189 [Harpegnathos saltator]EFN80281.1 hypothetical protein EAI_10796 [Harpegnathos saltator]
MSVTGVGLCLTVLLTCVIVDMLVQAASLRRHHSHHSRPQHDDFEELTSLGLSPKHSEKRHVYPRHRDNPRERRGYLQESGAGLFPSSDYEDVEVQAPLLHRRRHVSRNYQGDEYERQHSARRLHHRHPAPSNSYLSVNERLRQLNDRQANSLPDFFELEVRQAQNSTVCNYTVVPVPDPKGCRTPKNLEHIMCNRAGSSCFDTNSHCCIQTYKKIDVSYGDGTSDVIKLYVGCVCVRQELLIETKLPIDN